MGSPGDSSPISDDVEKGRLAEAGFTAPVGAGLKHARSKLSSKFLAVGLQVSFKVRAMQAGRLGTPPLADVWPPSLGALPPASCCGRPHLRPAARAGTSLAPDPASCQVPEAAACRRFGGLLTFGGSWPPLCDTSPPPASLHAHGAPRSP